MLKIQHKNFNKDWFQHKWFLLCVHSEDLSSGNILLPHSGHSTLIAFRIFTSAHMPQSAFDSTSLKKKKDDGTATKKDCRVVLPGELYIHRDTSPLRITILSLLEGLK